MFVDMSSVYILVSITTREAGFERTHSSILRGAVCGTFSEPTILMCNSIMLNKIQR